MKDSDCVRFLQQVLPRLGLRWAGFRKVRRQVCKRLSRRLEILNLSDLNAYGAYLERHPSEWAELNSLCRISISRFLRDRGVWEFLRDTVLPVLVKNVIARGDTALHAWSAGCASGEEPYTLNLIWHLSVQPHSPAMRCQILATDIDPHLLSRARTGCYPPSSLRELPVAWREQAFVERENGFCLRPQYRLNVRFRQQNIQTDTPGQSFDLIMCRNLAFTYFDEASQRQVLARFRKQLQPGGVLVIGKTEEPPAELEGIIAWEPHSRIYRRS